MRPLEGAPHERENGRCAPPRPLLHERDAQPRSQEQNRHGAQADGQRDCGLLCAHGDPHRAGKGGQVRQAARHLGEGQVIKQDTFKIHKY